MNSFLGEQEPECGLSETSGGAWKGLEPQAALVALAGPRLTLRVGTQALPARLSWGVGWGGWLVLALRACLCVVPGHKLAPVLLAARPPLGLPHPETQALEVLVS